MVQANTDRLDPGEVARAVARDPETRAALTAFSEFISLMHRSRMLHGPGVPGRGVLIRLAKSGPMRMSDLADLGHVDQSTMSRQVARLEADGLVRRTPDPDDRRAQLVTVTEAGLSEARKVIEGRIRRVADRVERWSATDRATFARLLQELVDDLDTHLQEGPTQ